MLLTGRLHVNLPKMVHAAAISEPSRKPSTIFERARYPFGRLYNSVQWFVHIYNKFVIFVNIFAKCLYN